MSEVQIARIGGIQTSSSQAGYVMGRLETEEKKNKENANNSKPNPSEHIGVMTIMRIC
jgi:hypothetical protein